MTSGSRRLGPRAWWIAGGSIVAIFLVLAVVLSSRSGGAAGPGGTLALERFLRASGRTVEHRAAPPGTGTFVLLADLREPRDEGSLLDWARGGGRLVVADPGSVLPLLVGVRPSGAVGGLGVTRSLGPGCVAPEAAGVRRIAVAQTDELLSVVRAAAVPCYPVGGGSFAVDVPWGRGTVVVVGGVSPLTNALLASADNARFALDLVGSGPVAFGAALPAGTGEGTESVWHALPVGARAGLVAAALAAVLLALVRGRRLGWPIPEPALAPIPGSELVRARARLYRRSRSVGHAGAVLRSAASARLAPRLGVPPDAPGGGDLAARLADSGTVPIDRARALLTGPLPRDDGELIALGRELEEVERAVEGRG